jgi:FHA domain
MQVCQVCQHQNPQGAEYCEECGAALGAASGAAPVQPPVTSAPVASTAPAASTASTPALTASTTSATPATSHGSTPPGPTASATGLQPRLLGKRHGAPTGEEIPLLGERLVVGRFDPETGPVDIDLSASPETQHVSRQHGELYREADGRWFVRDLGSTNGVFVKRSSDASFGQRITEPREIANGDELAFGNARFVFRTE